MCLVLLILDSIVDADRWLLSEYGQHVKVECVLSNIKSEFQMYMKEN